ncbi:nuclear transport factor 2 family protein [Metasolibacillus meyeri]|uniref:Nuclear transport factor 2 family protein n=1 Tax=Metasolibacillus meyeri TaxID=1071052 RepID=A0AAW9NY14_9BACL|nr:nuclear transport factor 2 family protein [Metasolibacillus meyeri]MEC1180153.1 nuclear transport factor 2 family protein [Metasolibacillus meyeri]
MNNDIISVFHAYNEALIKGDFPAVFETIADDIKWHQPGENTLSGEIVGKQALGEHLGKFAERSNGTFRIITNWVSSNDCFVAANVTFLAERDDEKLDMNGTDLFKIENGQIQEVWLFSSEQDIEDKFWK